MTELADFIVFVGGPVLIWIGAAVALDRILFRGAQGKGRS